MSKRVGAKSLSKSHSHLHFPVRNCVKRLLQIQILLLLRSRQGMTFADCRLSYVERPLRCIDELASLASVTLSTTFPQMQFKRRSNELLSSTLPRLLEGLRNPYLNLNWCARCGELNSRKSQRKLNLPPFLLCIFKCWSRASA